MSVAVATGESHVAGVHAAQHGVDLDVVDQFVGVLNRLGRGADVIAFDDDDLLAQHAACGVQVIRGLARAGQGRNAEVRRAGGRHVAVETDLDVGGKRSAAGARKRRREQQGLHDLGEMLGVHVVS
ncbi:hypothetical protein G6F68_014629 [Rhizopus microsporus]|nr:hypothetical protein G6F68_014629 [Rhizopus microsporus]